MAREENPLHGPSEDLKPTALQLVHKQHFNTVPNKIPHGFGLKELQRHSWYVYTQWPEGLIGSLNEVITYLTISTAFFFFKG